MTSSGRDKASTIGEECVNESSQNGDFSEFARMLKELDERLLQRRTADALANGFSSLAEMEEHERKVARESEEEWARAMEKRAALEGKTVAVLIAELDYPQRDSPRPYLDTGIGTWSGNWDCDCEG